MDASIAIPTDTFPRFSLTNQKGQNMKYTAQNDRY